MTEIKEKSYGSDSLGNLIERLQSTSDPKRRYEYILWLAKSLPMLTEDFHLETTKVKGCISEVYVLGILLNNHPFDKKNLITISNNKINCSCFFN